jgi:hypothetical protein
LELAESQTTGNKTKTNLLKKAKAMLEKTVLYVVTIGIVYSYLGILGLEESQSLKYISLLTLSYASSDLPRLLPVHQFVSLETMAVQNRIRCLLYNDQEQCLSIEIIRCEIKGKTTEAYE